MRVAVVCALLALGCGAAPEPTSWALVEHFPFATIGVEPTLIDLGTLDARPALAHGWGKDEYAGGLSFVWAIDEASAIDFHLAEPRDVALRFRCSPFAFAGGPPQSVTFDLNDRLGPRVALRAGMADYEVVLPRAAGRSGRNRLTMRYAYARAPSEVGQSRDARRLAVAWDVLRFGDANGAAARPAVDEQGVALVIPVGTALTYHLRVPPGAVFRVADVELAGDSPATVALRLDTDDGMDEVLGRLDPQRAIRAIPFADRFAGVARLTLTADGRSPSTSVRLVAPRIEAPASADRSARPQGRRPNVLLYLVDTLRADRVGCYGHDAPTTPHLDAFAQDAVRFADAMAESPWTRASVASLFTGLPARSHGVNGRTDALPEEAVTLAERLAGVGYETAAFVTNGNVAPIYGFAQGFEVYDLLPGSEIPGPDGIVRHPLPSAADVTERALRWLDLRDGSRPFLLYLHTADPHGPYQPPAKLRARFGAAGESAEIGSLAMLRSLHEGTLAVDAALVRTLQSLYDAEIAQNDEQFGRVLTGLRERGLYDDALIVFLSDHGEEFHEHGGWEHGHTLYDELTHVPLLLKLPGNVHGGLRVDRTVQLGDVLPTLVVYTGVAPSGASTLLTSSAAPRAATAHLDLDGRTGDSIVEGRWHYVHTAERVALFDRAADPGEQHDVSAEHPVLAGYLRALLAEHAAQASTLPRRRLVVTDDVRRNLEALGYLPGP